MRDLGAFIVRYCSYFFVFVLSGLGWGNAILAQVIQSASLEQQQEQKRIEQKVNREAKSDFENLAPLVEAPAVEVKSQNLSIELNGIEIFGNTIFSNKTLRRFYKEYLGHKIDLSVIDEIKNDIVNHYIDHGYITTRADYSSGRDLLLNDGIIHIQIIEGKIADYEYLNPDGSILRKREVQVAFPFKRGDFLNIRDLDQGLEQMNRLRSNDVTTRLYPGDSVGESILQIVNTRSKRWFATFGVDNFGSEDTGEWQGRVIANHENMLGLNENFSFSYQQNLEQHEINMSRNLAFQAEFVWGYWDFYYNLNYFDYESSIDTATNDFISSGSTLLHDAGLSYVLKRNRNSKTSLGFNVVARDVENLIEDVLLDTSTHRLTVSNVSLSHSYRFNRGIAYGAFTYSHGTDWFGAEDDSDDLADLRRAQFDRFSLDLTLIKLWDIGIGRWNPRTDLRMRGVWSDDELYSSEEISIGGPYSVRGFKDREISGRRGGYGRFDLSVPLGYLPTNYLKNVFGEFNCYAGYDIGSIVRDDDDVLEDGTLTSWTLGLKSSGDYVFFDLAFSQPITASDYLDEDNFDLYFRLIAKF